MPPDLWVVWALELVNPKNTRSSHQNSSPLLLHQNGSQWILDCAIVEKCYVLIKCYKFQMHLSFANTVKNGHYDRVLPSTLVFFSHAASIPWNFCSHFLGLKFSEKETRSFSEYTNSTDLGNFFLKRINSKCFRYSCQIVCNVSSQHSFMVHEKL